MTSWIHTVETLRLRIKRSVRMTPVDKILCRDGFTVSVQAGDYIYCTPRDESGTWTAVEIGFPSERLPDCFEQYADDPNPSNLSSVWGYVPIEMVVRLINDHGGEVSP